MSIQLSTFTFSGDPSSSPQSGATRKTLPEMGPSTSRHHQILAIKEQIAANTYESSERLESAMQALLEDFQNG